ncbi:phenylalanyl-tRNA synthetase beta subunit [Persephonella hydrogeniphila]|uniref:Phenylalanine--tRNA ligase beta subunit n=1 Tax=Persephonella hydrogeniphila TaxID=198703 RepID=A0A285NJF2_9AQUI|nr:phenylalanine--tRNA ligase subunit beta [Persephonella hydrogeniphila]SNZ09642.1 phenylalanyl-tRNA synthetase beta subunit [Persephonella hydrogeniphila]
MRVPYSWIKEFVDIDISAEKIAEKLNETGIETTVEKFGRKIERITVVRILSVKKHPERDKLLVCEATDGQNKYQIITAAQNVFEGAKVILAKEGAQIGDIHIKPVKFGSLVSEGMLLSLEELGVAEKAEGVFILPKNTKEGEDPNKILGLGEDDIFEIEITPNRGDALSVRGLAREIGAIFGIKRKEKFPVVSIAQEEVPEIKFLSDKVFRYRAVVIKGVKIAPSPFEIQLKLIKSGQTPINNVVDITNYILIQEGQPLHAFDLKKIEGDIVVRNAYEGEKIVTLDGEERVLTSEDLVIADSKKAIAIAGVIGGENTKVDENTTDILLEAAVFDNISIRKTSKRLSISTESSYRFERGVDIENLPNAQDKAVELIIKTAGGEAFGEKDVYPQPYKPREIKLREKTTKRVLGFEIPKEKAKELLERLEIPTDLTEDGTISKIPAFRAFDLEREIDLVEEVGRLEGLNIVEETFPKISVQSFRKSDEFLFELRTREFLKDNGFDEVVSYTFVDEDIYNILEIPVPTIRIKNYLLKTQSIMRDNLAVSLIKTLKHNLRFQNTDLKIFEISSVFFENHEEIRAGLLATGKLIKGFSFTKGDQKYSTLEKWDFLKFKGVIESYLKSLGLFNVDLTPSNRPYLNPYESAELFIDGMNIGYIGKIHPKKADTLEIPKDVYIGELKLRYVPRELSDKAEEKEGYIFNIYKKRAVPKFKELPKFPAVKRDFAFEVDESLQVDKLLRAIRESSEYVEKVELFDIYYINENRKSIAVSVDFRAEDRSLSDEEVNKLTEDLLENLRKRFEGIKLRNQEG